jgi:hypothetical protein
MPVGACAPGTQTCGASNEFYIWGSCIGATHGSAENCSDGIDNDCDGKVDCADPDCGAAPNCQPICVTGATSPCYTGPSGTSGVGQCHPGTRTCDSTGNWGPCMGEVTPGDSEFFLNGNCGDGIDNDCNGIKDCQEIGCLLSGSCGATICTGGTTQNCYDGPAGTEGVGPCQGGTQTCASDGKSWGPCTGEVLPTNEGAACSDGIDNDCNGKIDCADDACVSVPACCVASSGTVDETIWANSPTDLYKIDPTTFAVTHVGSFGISDMTDIALTTTGELWGVSFSTLYMIDKTSATASSVASIGSGENALTFLPGGTLLAADGSGDLSTISTSTGSGTSVGNYGNSLSSAGDLVAVGNLMYGTSATKAGGADASSNNVLIRVNTSTGVATVVGPTGYGNVWGLAYVHAKVIGFTTAGQLLQIDPATGTSTVISTTSIQFWGATMSPSVPINSCSP